MVPPSNGVDPRAARNSAEWGGRAHVDRQPRGRRIIAEHTVLVGDRYREPGQKHRQGAPA